MYKIPVVVDESGCATASQPIPADAIMTVMNDKEVVIYEVGDELPTV